MPCKDDKPKDAVISPFQASSDYFVSAKWMVMGGGVCLDNRFKRNEMLIKETGQAALSAASVIVFGVGGVGSSAVESLARSGVGHFTLVDSDVVDVTNINRQLLAVTDTVGKPKVSVQAERIRAINPEAQVLEKQMFYLPENADEIDLSKYDYIIDAIDTVSAKIELIVRANKAGVPIISCMVRATSSIRNSS